MYPEWFLTKNRPKNRRENRGERRERSFGRFHSGELRRIYRGVTDLSEERRELHDFRRRHFSRISIGMRENLRNRTKQTQKCPKKWYFGHFWPLRAVLEALKTPYRCELKSKLVKLFMGHILKAFRAKKIGPGWQGGSETNFGVGAWKRLSRRKFDR